MYDKLPLFLLQITTNIRHKIIHSDSKLDQYRWHNQYSIVLFHVWLFVHIAMYRYATNFKYTLIMLINHLTTPENLRVQPMLNLWKDWVLIWFVVDSVFWVVGWDVVTFPFVSIVAKMHNIPVHHVEKLSPSKSLSAKLLFYYLTTLLYLISE